MSKFLICKTYWIWFKHLLSGIQFSFSIFFGTSWLQFTVVLTLLKGLLFNITQELLGNIIFACQIIAKGIALYLRESTWVAWFVYEVEYDLDLDLDHTFGSYINHENTIQFRHGFNNPMLPVQNIDHIFR